MATIRTESTGAADAGGRVGADGRPFAIRLCGIAVLAALVRVAYVLVVFRDRGFGFGDQFYFVEQGRLLVNGYLFVNPYAFAPFFGGDVRPGAFHPPLFSVYMAGAYLFHLRTPLEGRFAACALGVAGVVVVGLAGRRIGGARTGLIAATLAAVMPYLFINDAKVLSESLLVLMTALTLLAASAYWHRPTPLRLALVGAAIAGMALTRAEAVLLYPLLLLPLALLAARRDGTSVWRPLGAGILAGLVLLGPWCAWNTARFHRPVLVSNGGGATLAVANCDRVYRGPLIGWWSAGCAVNLSRSKNEAVRSRDGADRAWRYAKAHLSEVPAVVGARLGRQWGVFRPWQTANLESLSKRGLWASRIGWMLGLALLPFAAYGLVLLRRRGETIVPMVAMLILVTVTAGLFWGGPRFGVPADVALCILAGVALAELWARFAARRARAREVGPV